MSGRYKAVPTGTIANGKPVAVNSTGTVSQVADNSVSFNIGSNSVFESGNMNFGDRTTGITFDSSNNKIVIVYADNGNSNYGTAVVGTVSGTDISFGTPVVYKSAQSNDNECCFDSNANKVVVAYSDEGNVGEGHARVGTVSGTSISFGTEATFNSSNTESIGMDFDSNSNIVAISHRNVGNSGYGELRLGLVSGTDISFGTNHQFETASTAITSCCFNSTSNTMLIAFRDVADSSKGKHRWATLSESSGSTRCSFGSTITFESGAVDFISTCFDSANNKVIIAYEDSDNSEYGTVVVVTANSTAGTPVVFSSAQSRNIAAIYDVSTGKVLIAWQHAGDSSGQIKVIEGTVSGTSISFGTAVDVNNRVGKFIVGDYDSNANKSVIAYAEYNDSGGPFGQANVVTSSKSDQNLTSENYIGLSNACSFHGATETYTVTVASGVFYLNGLANPPIQLLKGHTYIFDQADNTNDGHPLHFKNTGGSQYTSGVTVTGTAGTSGANVTIVVPIDATEPSQYYCTVHGNSMGNVITIEESFAEIDVVGTVNKHQSGLTAGQTYYVQTDGTLGLTADDPSVIAGTAISATEIIVKG